MAADFLVIGTGATFKPVSRELQEYLRERAISVEVLDTVRGRTHELLRSPSHPHKRPSLPLHCRRARMPPHPPVPRGPSQVNAASTFNILNQESRNVAACMFPL